MLLYLYNSCAALYYKTSKCVRLSAFIKKYMIGLCWGGGVYNFFCLTNVSSKQIRKSDVCVEDEIK